MNDNMKVEGLHALYITCRFVTSILPAKYLDVAILISKTKNKNNKTTHTKKNTLTDDVTATVRAVNDFFFIVWADSR